MKQFTEFGVLKKPKFLLWADMWTDSYYVTSWNITEVFWFKYLSIYNCSFKSAAFLLHRNKPLVIFLMLMNDGEELVRWNILERRFIF